MNDALNARLVGDAMSERLAVMPAVVVTGARQTGKSTLARRLAPSDRAYYSLDDMDTLDLARRDPNVLVGSDGPVTLDEVQRAPSLLLAVKRSIDERRVPGQYLLTGSANLLLMRDVSETLAGRASYLTLWPMTRSEQRGGGRCGIWDDILASPPGEWPDLVSHSAEHQEDWRELARRGGYPTPALHLRNGHERAIWFEGYERTYLERDLLQLSAIAGLPDFRRLMRAACHRLGQILNQTELGRDVALPQPTVHRYLNLLETSYLLVRLPAFSVNRTRRLIKSPKLYWNDTGLALHLSGGEPGGCHLENIVLGDMLAWRDARLERADIHYWRTTNGEEVDFVIEAGDRLLPVEVKATSRPRLADTTHLRAFRGEYGNAALPGLLLHAGGYVGWVAPDVLAAPWWSVI